MSDSYTVITHQSWEERLKNALIAAGFGFLLCSAAFFLLYWNEGKAVQRAQTLEEGARIVKSINANHIYSTDEGKLVHLSGEIAPDKTSLTDKVFGVMVDNVIKLRRAVEMYQWQESRETETRDKLGGGTETVTTYSYRKIWSEELIEPSRFHKDGYFNPSSMPIKGEAFTAEPVTLGEFTLSSNLVENLNDYQHLPISTETFDVSQKQTQLLDRKIHYNYGNYYVGEDPAYPQIGDLRIKFEIVLPTTISVIAKQSESYLMAYITKAGGSIELFEYGVVDAKTMFKKAQKINTIKTWFLRLVGFLTMFLGLILVFNVFKILAAVIPFLGKIVEWLNLFISFILAVVFSLITIALAWLYYRPLLGIILIVIAVSLLFLLKFGRKSQQPALESQTLEEPQQPAFGQQKSVLKSQESTLAYEVAIPQKTSDLDTPVINNQLKF